MNNNNIKINWQLAESTLGENRCILGLNDKGWYVYSTDYQCDVVSKCISKELALVAYWKNDIQQFFIEAN